MKPEERYKRRHHPYYYHDNVFIREPYVNFVNPQPYRAPPRIK